MDKELREPFKPQTHILICFRTSLAHGRLIDDIVCANIVLITPKLLKTIPRLPPLETPLQLGDFGVKKLSMI